jgi:DNA-binding transcriptional ArsR family regulator
MVEYKQETLDQTFAALANPTRRNLMERLARGEATVTELAKPYSISLAAVSKHLKVLEAAGLVRRRVEGRQHHLSIDPGRLAMALAWLSHFREFWQESLDALESMVEQGNASSHE